MSKLLIEEFWDNNHRTKNIENLSGCAYDETINFLKLKDSIIPGNRVLEIGVGLGYVTKGLCENGLIVSGLDISKIALEVVNDYCEKVFTVDKLEEMPSDYFDFIICHNVVQHITTDVLIKELSHCIRSLRMGGIFAVEFVSTDTVDDTWNDKYVYGGGLPGFCRTPKYLEKLVKSVGGSCELVVDNKCNFGIVKGCHVFHVKREVFK